MNTKDAALSQYRQSLHENLNNNSWNFIKRYAYEQMTDTVPEVKRLFDAFNVCLSDRRQPVTPEELDGSELCVAMAHISRASQKEWREFHGVRSHKANENGARPKRGRIGAVPKVRTNDPMDELLSPALGRARPEYVNSHDTLCEALKTLDIGATAIIVNLTIEEARSTQTYMTRVARALKWDYSNGTPYTGTIVTDANVFMGNKRMALYKVTRFG